MKNTTSRGILKLCSGITLIIVSLNLIFRILNAYVISFGYGNFGSSTENEIITILACGALVSLVVFIAGIWLVVIGAKNWKGYKEVRK